MGAFALLTSFWFFLLGPLVLAALLGWRVPRYRKLGARGVLGYLVFQLTLTAVALALVAHLAQTRVLMCELPFVTWFVIGWHFAWLSWQHVLSRLRVPSVRHALTAFVFVPVLGAALLTHRCKWGDGRDPQSTQQLPFATLRLVGEGGSVLEGWFIASAGARRTIAVFPGAGANKGNFVWFVGPLVDQGYNVAIFDLHAHGGSSGWLTTWGIREAGDVRAVVRWLKRERAQQAEKVVALGSSQGAMAVALAAADEPAIDAVVLDSPFVSHRQWAHDHAAAIPWLGPLLADVLLLAMSAWTSTDFFTPSAASAVAALAPRPVMIIHGDDDTWMPRSYSQALFDAARGPRELWFGPGGHSTIVTAEPANYGARVRLFLEETLGAREPTPATATAPR